MSDQDKHTEPCRGLETRETARSPRVAPPDDIIPAILSCNLLLVQTPDVAVYVSRLDVYPGGFEVNVVVLSVEPSRDPFDLLRDVRNPHGRDEPLRNLKFGLEFADGRRAWSIATPWDVAGGAKDNAPAGPVMIGRSGSGAGRRWEQTYWVWPLPPKDIMSFMCEWPERGIGLHQCAVSADLVRSAATTAIKVFTDDA
jgi:hypothetical protein